MKFATYHYVFIAYDITVPTPQRVQTCFGTLQLLSYRWSLARIPPRLMGQ